MMTRDAARAIDVNIAGTLSVLQTSADAGVERFMFASSVYVFSRAGSVYRTTKQAAENLVNDLSTAYGVRSSILRFGSLYGPRADASNAIQKIVMQALSERKVDFWEDGSEVREYIHITDAVATAVDALDAQYDGKSLHITGRERISTAEMLHTLSEILGGDIQIHLNDEPFEGRYRLTPYAFETEVSQRLTRSTYVDFGLGLLETIQQVNAMNQSEPQGKP